MAWDTDLIDRADVLPKSLQKAYKQILVFFKTLFTSSKNKMPRENYYSSKYLCKTLSISFLYILENIQPRVPHTASIC